jgi:hypothetical protein
MKEDYKGFNALDKLIVVVVEVTTVLLITMFFLGGFLGFARLLYVTDGTTEFFKATRTGYRLFFTWFFSVVGMIILMNMNVDNRENFNQCLIVTLIIIFIGVSISLIGFLKGYDYPDQFS